MKKLFLILAAAAMILSACSDDGDSNSSGSSGAAGSLQVVMKLSTDVGDSLVLRGTLSGSETDSVHEMILLDTISGETVSIDLDVESGTWVFQAFVYDGDLVVQQSDETTIEVAEDGNSTGTITLNALYGYVVVTVPLGLGNSKDIASGTLILNDGTTSYSYSLEIEEDSLSAYFKSDALLLGVTYQISIEISNSSGEILYTASESITLTSSDSTYEITLLYVGNDETEEDGDGSIAKVSLVVVIAEESSTLNLASVISTGVIRSPKAGEVLISEVYTIRSSEKQFVEIYNGTLDSISLSGCSIGGKSSSEMSYSTALDDVGLSPAGYYSIGGDSAEGVSSQTLDVSLIPSSKTSNKAILLVCDEVVIDSVYFGYTSSSLSCDSSLVPLSNNTSTHLVLSEWNDRLSYTAWCSGESTPGAAAPSECAAFECVEASSSSEE